MYIVSELDLPNLPVDQMDFASDPDRFLEPARAVHPWLGKFSKGYVVHGLQAARDMIYMDDKMGPHFEGLVNHFGATGTEWGRFMSSQMATLSGPRHNRLRASVASAFTPRSANQTRPLMRQVISALLDEWLPPSGTRTTFDFAEFASYFPITVMCGLLGLSAEPVQAIREALDIQMSCMSMERDLFPAISASYEMLYQFADTVISEREQSARHDENLLLDALIASKNVGGLDDLELRDLLISLLLAGYDTSKNALTLIIHQLLETPEMLSLCANDQEYCKKIIEEMLRHTSVVAPCRTLSEDVSYNDVFFPKGTFICFALSLAGRDPAAYSQPLAFLPEREQNPRHIAFGRGMHICLGQFLARAQLEEGLHLIAQRVANPKLAGEVTWRPFLGAWGIRTLPIEFEAI